MTFMRLYRFMTEKEPCLEWAEWWEMRRWRPCHRQTFWKNVAVEGEAKDRVEAGKGCEWGQERTFLKLGWLEAVLRGARWPGDVNYIKMGRLINPRPDWMLWPLNISTSSQAPSTSFPVSPVSEAKGTDPEWMKPTSSIPSPKQTLEKIT